MSKECHIAYWAIRAIPRKPVAYCGAPIDYADSNWYWDDGIRGEWDYKALNICGACTLIQFAQEAEKAQESEDE